MRSESFRLLVGNIDDLLNYYSGFPGMNLRPGRHLTMSESNGWFQNRTNYYFYVSARDRSIPLFSKPGWYLRTLLAQSRLSWLETLDFTRELTPQMRRLGVTTYLSKARSRRKFTLDVGACDTILRSRDRTFDATRIACDLVRAFLSAGGTLRVGVPVVHVERRRVSTVDTEYSGGNIIIAAGREIGRLSGVPVKSVRSPLLVVAPALSDASFAVMSPNVTDTINHIYHHVPSGNYSVLGDASAYEMDEKLDENRCHTILLDKTNQLFRTRRVMRETQMYLGVKTEIVKSGRRRSYAYKIVDNGSVLAVVPGKFSLAFSLAVNVCHHFGIDPPTEIESVRGESVLNLVREPEHKVRFEELRGPGSNSTQES